MTKKSNENSIHSSKTSYDKVIRRMEKQETHILNSPTLRISDNVAEQIKVQQPLIQAFQPLQDAMQSYHDLMEQNSLGFTDETASPSLVTQTLVSKNDLSSKTGSLSAVDMTIHPYRDIKFNSDVLVAFESAMITPELKDFRSQFESNVQTMGNGLSVVSDYVGGLTSQWDDALALNNVVERSIAAQNFAVVRMLPNYDELKLPRGGKKVLKS